MTASNLVYILTSRTMAVTAQLIGKRKIDIHKCPYSSQRVLRWILKFVCCKGLKHTCGHLAMSNVPQCARDEVLGIGPIPSLFRDP